MSDLNKDGLTPGQSVDFETLMKIKNKNKEVKSDGKQQERKEKTSVRTGDESKLQNTPKPTSKKKTKAS